MLFVHREFTFALWSLFNSDPFPQTSLINEITKEIWYCWYCITAVRKEQINMLHLCLMLSYRHVIMQFSVHVSQCNGGNIFCELRKVYESGSITWEFSDRDRIHIVSYYLAAVYFHRAAVCCRNYYFFDVMFFFCVREHDSQWSKPCRVTWRSSYSCPLVEQLYVSMES